MCLFNQSDTRAVPPVHPSSHRRGLTARSDACTTARQSCVGRTSVLPTRAPHTATARPSPVRRRRVRRCLHYCSPLLSRPCLGVAHACAPHRHSPSFTRALLPLTHIGWLYCMEAMDGRFLRASKREKRKKKGALQSIQKYRMLLSACSWA